LKILGLIALAVLVWLLFRNDAALFTDLTDQLAAWLTEVMLEGVK